MILQLTLLERAVLEALLSGPGARLKCLRAQINVCKVLKRQFTGVGFFTDLAVDASSGCSNVRGDLRLHDVTADIEGLQYGAAFVLFVKDGVLEMLEGASFAEAWPKPDTVGKFALRYVNVAHRALPPELIAD